jgi:transposase-like protein
MRIEAESGTTRVSVLGLARRLEMSNATFWRNYRENAIEIRQAAETSGKPARASRPENEARLAGQNASLRQERDALAGQLEAALAHLRRLTTGCGENWKPPAPSAISAPPAPRARETDRPRIAVDSHHDLPSDGHEANAMAITEGDQVRWWSCHGSAPNAD